MQEITILDWLEETALRYPDRTAFLDEEYSLTFSGVKEAAQQIGGRLLPYTHPNNPVIVLCGRHVFTPVCFLGVVYSGCFYVPLDATMPSARLDRILSVLSPDRDSVLITDQSNLDAAHRLSFDGHILLLEDLLGDLIREHRTTDHFPADAGNSLPAGTSADGFTADSDNASPAGTSADASTADSDNASPVGTSADASSEEAATCARLQAIRSRMGQDQPLYTIFTSGSTGVPKGVITSHNALMTYIRDIAGVLSIDSTDRLANQCPLDYIAAVRDIYLPLLCGASSVILPKKYTSMSASLFTALNDYQVTTLCWSTAALSIPVKMRAFEACQPEFLKKICFSGSVMPGSVLKVWQEHLPDTLFVNQYGPTETTASCTYYVVTEKVDTQTHLPIGQPFPQYRILLLDPDGRKVSDGEIGEICVLGPALALGYYRNPEQTKASFVTNPLNDRFEERMYRTGDLGRIREDGLLEFHGRMDRQIKHLGHRIELGELEQITRGLDDVDECCALYQKERELLYLFYEGTAEPHELAVALRGLLPGFMVPRMFRKLEELPKLPNGKIDMKQLEEQFS